MSSRKSKSASPNSIKLTDLPEDMLYEIASRLSIHDKVNTAKASKALSTVNANKASKWYKDAYKYMMNDFFSEETWHASLEFLMIVPETADQTVLRVFPFKPLNGKIRGLKLKIGYNDTDNSDYYHKLEIRVSALMNHNMGNPMIKMVNGHPPSKDIPDVRTLFQYFYQHELPAKDTKDAGISAAELVLKTFEVMGKLGETVVVATNPNWKNNVKKIFMDIMKHSGIQHIEERRYKGVPEYKLGNIPPTADITMIKVGPLLPLELDGWSRMRGFSLEAVPKFKHALSTVTEWKTPQPYDLVFKLSGEKRSLILRHKNDGDVEIWSSTSMGIRDDVMKFLMTFQPWHNNLIIQGSPNSLIDDIVGYINYRYSEYAQSLGRNLIENFVPMSGGTKRRSKKA